MSGLSLSLLFGAGFCALVAALFTHAAYRLNRGDPPPVRRDDDI